MAPQEHDGPFDRAYFYGSGSNYILGYHRLRSRLFWRRRLRLVRGLVSHGTLLDVGCAFGFFLALLDGRYESYGVDISSYAIVQARRLLERPERIRQADIATGIPFSGPFDLITAFDIVEHLPQPSAALRHLAQALRPGGFLVLEFPTRSTLIDRDRSHQYRAVPEWLLLLREAGLQVLRVHHYWTIGLRAVLIPTSRQANYVQIIATVTTR